MARKTGTDPYTNLSNAGIYSGVNTNELTLTAPPIGHSARKYRVLIKSTTNSCTDIISAEAVLTIAAPIAQTITGTDTLGVGDTTTWTSTTTPGTWNSATPAVATVNETTGEVTAISVGTSIITYSVTTTGSCVNQDTKTVTVIEADLQTVMTDNTTTYTPGTDVTKTCSIPLNSMPTLVIFLCSSKLVS
jgi:uncharacterized protein YjdB